MMSDSFVAKLIKQKESIQIEFISEFDAKRTLQTACSFLNNEGGWILIGYNGKNILGIITEIEQKVAELNELIAERIFPQPLIDVRIDKYNDKHLILMNVIKGSRQPYSFDGKYFVRIGSRTREANADEISLLMRSSNEYASTWEKQTLIDATIEDLVSDEVEKTIIESEKIGRGKSLPNNINSFLNYFQLLDFNIIKNGAVVLFGNDPVRFVTQCRIRITVMSLGKTGSHFDDTLLIEDNLFASFNRLQDYFVRNLPLVSEFKHDKWDRTTRKKYPMEAMDEAILNAMIHRDYADISGEIIINIYRDKIEIINSGEIPQDIIIGKSLIKEHHSVLRNPMIAHMFYLRGKIEKLGRGLSLIKNRFSEYGLKLPEWTTQNGYTTLTLYGTESQIELNERATAFLRKLKTSEQFNREDYEKFFEKAISEKTARNDISKLVDGNWVSKLGDGPSTTYIRTNKELPEIAG